MKREHELWIEKPILQQEKYRSPLIDPHNGVQDHQGAFRQLQSSIATSEKA
jgi:hypothetical protein